MHLGWVEGDSIRCAYHGWKFECSGRCIEQPAEEPGFARKVAIRTSPTREYLGLSAILCQASRRCSRISRTA
jgi:5,5'-dehydrodivanillate O-demethylase